MVAGFLGPNHPVSMLVGITTQPLLYKWLEFEGESKQLLQFLWKKKASFLPWRVKFYLQEVGIFKEIGLRQEVLEHCSFFAKDVVQCSAECQEWSPSQRVQVWPGPLSNHSATVVQRAALCKESPQQHRGDSLNDCNKSSCFQFALVYQGWVVLLHVKPPRNHQKWTNSST